MDLSWEQTLLERACAAQRLGCWAPEARLGGAQFCTLRPGGVNKSYLIPSFWGGRELKAQRNGATRFKSHSL